MPSLPRPSRPRAGSDPVERWISGMQVGSGPAGSPLGEGEIAARVVELEIFCQSYRSTPGELLLNWRRLAPDCPDAVRDYLRHNGIEVRLRAGLG